MDERTSEGVDGGAGGESAPQDLPVPRTGEDGKPIYDQEFFLALARHGRDVWNRWRTENPGIHVTFEGVDFREPENGLIDLGCAKLLRLFV
ncbi:MAG: hypothetical protein ACXWU0_03185 [Rhodoplanes sp.]